MADAGDEGEPAADPDHQTADRRVHLPVGPAGHDVVEPADLLAGLVAHRAAEQAGQRHDGVEDALGREDAARPPAALVRRAFRIARAPGNRRGGGRRCGCRLRSSTVAWPWSSLLWRPRGNLVGSDVSAGTSRHARGSATGACLRASPASGAHGMLVLQLSDGTEWACAGCATGGFAPRHGRTSFSVVPRAEWVTPSIPATASYRRLACDGTVAWTSPGRASRRCRWERVPCLAWTWPTHPKPRNSGAEIAGWLKDNLPEGWGEPGSR